MRQGLADILTHKKIKKNPCLMLDCYDMLPNMMRTEYQNSYYNTHKKTILKRKFERRIEALKRYGEKCACCGETIEEFLVLEKSGVQKPVVKCMNCRWVERYGNVCPHRKKKFSKEAFSKKVFTFSKGG